MKKMFNSYNLSNEEILCIIEKFENYITKESCINGKFDEDLN